MREDKPNGGTLRISVQKQLFVFHNQIVGVNIICCGFFTTNLAINHLALFINRKIEECFRIMKTDFSARPVYLQDDNRIKAHFLIYFLSLTIYRYLEKKLNLQYTCEELLDTLKAMNFAEIQEQGFIPLYKREKITDALHESCGFRTDYQFITTSKMKTIQKKSKGKE